MQSTFENTTIVRLTLTSKEAEWLRGVLENPLCIPENKLDSDMRNLFCDALDPL
jgi:hypothetical protein